MKNSASQSKNSSETDRTSETPVSSRINSKRSYKNRSGYKFYVKEKVQKENELSSPKAVYNEMKDIAMADQESLWVVYVNTKNKILGKDMVALGGVDSATVDMKILFRRILLNNAVSFFLVHNHPSNSIQPSEADKRLTENVKQASEMLQLRFLDHIIVAENDYYSFSNNGLL